MYRSFVNGSGTITVESVGSDYEAQDGELVTADEPTATQLTMTFADASVRAAAARRCREVDDFRDGQFAGGMPYQGKVLQLGDIDQQRIIAAGAQAKFAILSGASWPEDFGWIMADNTLLALDAAGMSAMADAAAAQVQAWIFNGYAHKQALRSKTQVAEVEAYDIESGW